MLVLHRANRDLLSSHVQTTLRPQPEVGRSSVSFTHSDVILEHLMQTRFVPLFAPILLARGHTERTSVSKLRPEFLSCVTPSFRTVAAIQYKTVALRPSPDIVGPLIFLTSRAYCVRCRRLGAWIRTETQLWATELSCARPSSLLCPLPTNRQASDKPLGERSRFPTGVPSTDLGTMRDRCRNSRRVSIRDRCY